MKKPLAIGDILKTRKDVFIEHKGVYLGPNAVLTNTPEKGEHLTTYDEFAGLREVIVARTGANSASVIRNSQKILSRPKRYHPALRNCEHTSYEAAYGKAKSPSLFAALFLSGIGLALASFRR